MFDRLAAHRSPASPAPLVFVSALGMMACSLMAATVPLTARADAQGCAVLEVQNVRPHQGHLMLAAYSSAADFSRKPITAVRVPAGEATMRTTVCGLPEGEVAFTLFQDLNGDSQLNMNMLGLPTEPWGASGTPGLMGPSWEKTRVTLPAPGALVVRMSN